MILGLSLENSLQLGQVLLLTISLYFTWRVVRDANNTRSDEFDRHRELLREQRLARQEEQERHAELLREDAEARRAQDERHQEENAREAKRRQEEAARRRQVDLELRLELVAERIAELEDVRWQMLDSQTGTAAMMRIPHVKMRLRTALISTGIELPKTQTLVAQGQIVPSEDQMQAALDELEQGLAIYAKASRIPWESESG